MAGDLRSKSKSGSSPAASSGQLEAAFNALNHISQGVCIFDGELRLVLCNQRFRELLDYPPQSVRVGARFEDLVRLSAERGDYGPGEVDALVQECLTHVRSGTCYRYERVHPNGTVLDVQSHSLPDGGFVGTYTDMTAVNAAERSLKQSEERLRDAIESMDGGFALFDPDDRLVLWNARYKDMHPSYAEILRPGITFEELIRTNVARGETLVSGEDPEGYIAGRVALHRRAFGSRIYRLSDGRWIQAIERRTGDGGIVGVRIDITELKEREMELARSTTVLTSVLENMGQGLLVVDPDRRIAAFNNLFFELNDIPLGRFRTGDPFDDLLRFLVKRGDFGPGNIDRLVDQRVAATEQTRPYVYQRTLPDGRVIEFKGHRMPDGGYIRIYTEVTERVRAEAALKESEERYALAVKGANDGIWDWDIERGLVYQAPRVREILDLGDEACTVAAAWWLERIHPNDIERYRAGIRDHFKGLSQHFDCEYRVRDARNRYRWILDRGVVVRDAEGRAYRMAGSIRDVTDRKEAEETLERTMQRAEAASRAKSDFLARMSHELRTPLNAILGFAEMVEREILGAHGNPGYKEYARNIRDAGAHLLELINDVLDLSRIEAGHYRLEVAPVDLSRVAVECLGLVRETARTSGTALVRSIPDDLPPFVGDARAIKQVLLNLLSNALRFLENREDGEVRLELRYGNGWFVIAVSDNGPGIRKEDIPRITAPFERGHTNAQVTEEGAGLGLAISRSLVELHGGRIEIESELGKGTMVRVRLPETGRI